MMNRRIQAGLAVALFLALLKFGLFPFYHMREEALQRVDVLRNAVAAKEGLVARSEKMDDLLNRARTAYEEAAEYYYQGFSDPPSLQLSLQKEIESLSASSDVKIISTDWMHSLEGEVIHVAIRVRCESSADDLIKLLSLIEGDKRFHAVDRLRVTARYNDPFVAAEIDLSVYGLRPSGGPPA